MVPPQSHFLSLNKDIQGPTIADKMLKTYDFVVAIDPGVKNTGVAIFTKNPDGSINLVTTVQLNYDRGTVFTALADTFNVTARICADLSAYADTKDKPNRVMYVVEHAYKDNTALGHYFPMLECLLYWSRPFAAPFEYDCVRVAPETVRKVHGLPRAATWLDRKKMTLGYVVNGTRRIISRHDTADAIAIGLAAMLRTKNAVHMRGTRLVNLEHYFAPSDPEPQPQDEMVEQTPFDLVHRDSAYSSSSSSSSSLPPISSIVQLPVIDISNDDDEENGVQEESDDESSYEEESVLTTPETATLSKSPIVEMPSDEEETRALFAELDQKTEDLKNRIENGEAEDETSDVSADLSCSDDRNGELYSSLDSSKAFGPLSHSRKYDKILEKKWQAAAEKP